MRLQDLMQDRIVRLLLPSLWLALLTSILEIVMLATVYAAVEEPYSDWHFLLFFLVLLGIMVVYMRLIREITLKLHHYIATVRQKLLQRLSKANLYDLEQMGSEQIYTALTLDIKAASDVAHLFADTVWASMTTVVGLAYVARLSWLAFFMGLALIGVGGLFYLSNQMLVKQRFSQARTSENALFDAIKQLLDGFQEFRLNDRKSDAFFHQALKPQANALEAEHLRAGYALENTDTIVYALWNGLILLIVLLLPLFGVLSQRIILALIGIILYLPPLVLIEEIPRLTLSNVSLRRLYELEDTLAHMEQEDWDKSEAFAQTPFHTLAYEAITFEYGVVDKRVFKVGPVSLTLRPSELIFLTGGNGSGKTTLVKMLLGFYPLATGRILLNGQDISPMQHRHLFAPIFSDLHLFDRLYGLADVDEIRVNTLLAQMQIDQKVQYRDGRFTTLDLSTGQKKRLALVCAMLEDRPIYIFDEWAAEQDPQFRRYFYETLLPQFKAQGKTVIAITHDNRYFHVADRVLKMEYGQMIRG